MLKRARLWPGSGPALKWLVLGLALGCVSVFATSEETTVVSSAHSLEVGSDKDADAGGVAGTKGLEGANETAGTLHEATTRATVIQHDREGQSVEEFSGPVRAGDGDVMGDVVSKSGGGGGEAGSEGLLEEVPVDGERNMAIGGAVGAAGKDEEELERDDEYAEQHEAASLAEMMRVIELEREEHQRALHEEEDDERTAREAEARAQQDEHKEKGHAHKETTAPRQTSTKGPLGGARVGASPLAEGLGGMGGRPKRGSTTLAQRRQAGGRMGLGGNQDGTQQVPFEVLMSQHERGQGQYFGGVDTERARRDADLMLQAAALINEDEGGNDDLAAEDAASRNMIAKILAEGEKDTPDWYRILSVGRRASQQAIKESFRSIVLRVHPDKTSIRGARQAFQLVQEAYETLSSVKEREKYDVYRVKLARKRWKERIRPYRDLYDEYRENLTPGRLALGAVILWVVF